MATTAIQDYGSRLEDPSSRKLGTFSYLPPLDAASVRRQIEFITARGWACAVEHAEPQRVRDYYWYMWKLPMFGESDVDTIMGELAACRNGNPGHHVRIVGYDHTRQTRGLSFVVYTAQS